MNKRTVTIPAMIEHMGFYQTDVTLSWFCPKCGGPRGEVFKARSYDGSRWMIVDSWVNACGHVDKYSECRAEARFNRENHETQTQWLDELANNVAELDELERR